MTPELRPVWCWARSSPFSRTSTSPPRAASRPATASPTIPAPTTTARATPDHLSVPAAAVASGPVPRRLPEPLRSDPRVPVVAALATPADHRQPRRATGHREVGEGEQDA